MQRTKQILLAFVIVSNCWFGMLAVHEMGHVFGALLSGGTVKKIVLYPLTISSTTVAPNPRPLIVVWSGPLAGVTLPLVLVMMCPGSKQTGHISTRKLALFFAGFCLIANGSYIGIGWIDRVGDCRDMANNGTPDWVMIGFGLVTVTGGFYLWHRLGTVRSYFHRQHHADGKQLAFLSMMLALLLALEFLFSPR